MGFSTDEKVWVVTHYLLYGKPHLVKEKFIEHFNIPPDRANETRFEYLTNICQSFFENKVSFR